MVSQHREPQNWWVYEEYMVHLVFWVNSQNREPLLLVKEYMVHTSR